MFIHYVQNTVGFNPKNFFQDVKGLLTGSITDVSQFSNSCNKTTSWLRSDPTEAPAWEYVQDVFWYQHQIDTVANLVTLTTAKQGDVARVNTATPAYYYLSTNNPTVAGDWKTTTVANYNAVEFYNGMRGVFRRPLSDDPTSYKYMTVSVGRHYGQTYGINIFAHDNFDPNDPWIVTPWVNGYLDFGYSNNIPFTGKPWHYQGLEGYQDQNNHLYMTYCPDDLTTWPVLNNYIQMRMNNDSFFAQVYYNRDYSMVHGVTERTRIGKWDTPSYNKSIFGSFNLRHTSSGGDHVSDSGKMHFPRYFRPETTTWVNHDRTAVYTGYDDTYSFVVTFIGGGIMQDCRPSCDENMLPVYDLYEMTCTAQQNLNNSNEGGNISKKSKMYKISSFAGKSGEVVKYGLDEYMIWRPSITQGTNQYFGLAVKIS